MFSCLHQQNYRQIKGNRGTLRNFLSNNTDDNTTNYTLSSLHLIPSLTATNNNKNNNSNAVGASVSTSAITAGNPLATMENNIITKTITATSVPNVAAATAASATATATAANATESSLYGKNLLQKNSASTMILNSTDCIGDGGRKKLNNEILSTFSCNNNKTVPTYNCSKNYLQQKFLPDEYMEEKKVVPQLSTVTTIENETKLFVPTHKGFFSSMKKLDAWINHLIKEGNRK